MPGWMKWTVSLLIGSGVIVAGWKLSDSKWFFWVLPLFFIVNCLFLVVVVLLQSGKAADIAGAFGGAGSQTAFGPRGAATLLSRATTWCAVMFMLCSLALVLHTDKTVGQGGASVLEKVSRPAPKTPAAPTPAPAAPASQPNAPASQPPATQTPAPQSNPSPSSQTPTTQPATQTPSPAASQPAKSAPAQPAPAQPAPAQTPPTQPKKP